MKIVPIEALIYKHNLKVSNLIGLKLSFVLGMQNKTPHICKIVSNRDDFFQFSINIIKSHEKFVS